MFNRFQRSGVALFAAATVFVSSEPALAASASAPRANVNANAALTYHRLTSQSLKPVFVAKSVMISIAAAARGSKPPAGGKTPDRAARKGLSPQRYAALKSAALHAHIAGAPVLDVTAALQAPASVTASVANTPFSGIFEGLADSASVCPTAGCQPPDQALAASPSAVVQAVNTSVATYDASTGAMRPGWPLDFNAFLGNRPAAAVAACNPYGPFLSDPRAFYDPNDKRFFVSVGQFDAPGFGGPADTCGNLSLIWVAVSVDANPDDGFYTVALDASEGGVSLADYPRLGFDANTVEVSTNSFSFATGAFTDAPMFYLSKYDLENGILTASYGYSVQFNGLPLDTIQPVETLAPLSAQPGFIYSLASFNINFGNGGCSNGCSNLAVVGFINPLSPNPGFVGALVSTPLYLLPPNADNPYCTAPCVETLDTRISATPVYVATSSGGAMSWALETGQANQTQIVPSFLWGIIDAAATHGNPQANFSVRTRKTGYVIAGGDVANAFPATMLTQGGTRLTLTADVMGSLLAPAQVAYTYAGGALSGPFRYHIGVAPDSLDGRWGDYSATAFDGSHIWLAGQYSGGGGDWATAFAKI